MPSLQTPKHNQFQPIYYTLADLVYLIKISRISRNYTAQELAFLVGKPGNYIAEREQLLPGKHFTLTDMVRLADVFDRQLTSMYMNNPLDLEKIAVRVTVRKENGAILHSIEQREGNGVIKRLCLLYEYEITVTGAEKEMQEKQLAQIIKSIGKMIANNYFNRKPRRALEIFRYSSNILRQDIYPHLLQKALAQFTGKHKTARLKRIYHRETGYTYQLVGRRKERGEEGGARGET
jgi:hypothetical protein